MSTLVSVLGLGIMGGGIARRLLARGFSVAVYNRDSRKAGELAREGARACATPREAAAGADVILAMIADDAASKSIWIGPEGALAGAAAGAVCLEASTLSAAWVLELAAAAAARGCGFLDCPVTGSKTEAASGGLKFLVGGDSATLERARPVMSELSKEIIHLGPVGAGSTLKLLNNSLNGVQIAAFAQVLAELERSGIDRERAVDVILNGASASPIVKAVGSRIVASDFAPHFPLRLMAKDLAYATEGASSLTLAVVARECFAAAASSGIGGEDIAALIKPLRGAVVQS